MADAKAAGAPGLSVRALGKEYRSPSGPLKILNGIDLEAAPGEAVAVMGPSGSGKSTLLQILGGLEPPTSGEVRLGGADPHALGEREAAEFRNRRIGFVFQDHHLLPQLTVLENVLVPTLVRRDRETERDGRLAAEILERVGLGGRLDHLPAEISGGERQRAAIARALLGGSGAAGTFLVLADEPTGNLDRTTAREVGELLLEAARDRGAILIAATHSLELAQRFPRRLVLDRGRLRETQG